MEVHEQDRYLPIANISRIMKRSIPPTAKISKDAKECVQECVSEFIAFITTSDKCKSEKRKTINGDDLLYAMNALGFEKYVEPLRLFLSKYREGSLDVGDDQLGRDVNSMMYSLPMNTSTQVPNQVHSYLLPND
ncbi:hypothetical protein JH06_5524 [Blastocystis sp. subtype 4]|uniref:hypothetical protein n=1 Tax=Blastocystis sp. subtype 4 TaxID=944170 RepID=UPI0007120F94|nr:hypothetical protein JH06_5524 [Blastocystis sp. subtype 4]KNB41748.1 hypothetical protein JH06_5524 [Blastocystis sp. subtype 4]|eukprot:XP_014525191.1 hypothetical protein JH06_5524 [Blastocystis sp. subtype 4]